MAAAGAQPHICSGRLATLKSRKEFQSVRKGRRCATGAFVLEGRQRTAKGRGGAGEVRLHGGPRRRRGGRAQPDPTPPESGGQERAGEPCAADFDYVVVARRPALDAKFEALVRELAKALDRVHRPLPQPTRDRAGGANQDSTVEIVFRKPDATGPGQPEEPSARHRALGGRAAGVADVLCRPKLKDEQERRQRVAAGADPEPSRRAAPTVAPARLPQAAAPQPRRRRRRRRKAAMPPSREAALQAGPRVRIDTPSLQGSIALQGGRIDDLVLAKYRETVRPNSPNVVLFSPSGAPAPYYAEYGWVAGAGVGAADAWPRHRLARWRRAASLTPASPVTLVWDNGQGPRFPPHDRGRRRTTCSR